MYFGAEPRLISKNNNNLPITPFILINPNKQIMTLLADSKK